MRIIKQKTHLRIFMRETKPFEFRANKKVGKQIKMNKTKIELSEFAEEWKETLFLLTQIKNKKAFDLLIEDLFELQGKIITQIIKIKVMRFPSEDKRNFLEEIYSSISAFERGFFSKVEEYFPDELKPKEEDYNDDELPDTEGIQ